MSHMPNKRGGFDLVEARKIVEDEIIDLHIRREDAEKKFELQTVLDIDRKLRKMESLADKPRELIAFIREPPISNEFYSDSLCEKLSQ